MTKECCFPWFPGKMIGFVNHSSNGVLITRVNDRLLRTDRLFVSCYNVSKSTDEFKSKFAYNVTTQKKA